MNIKLYNTYNRELMDFIPLKQQEVSLYACGPTVYNYAHIGNLRTYIFEDILRRTLEYGKYLVTHVMNITDVGHLTGDNDDGEDKMLKSSRETGKTVWEIAEFYTDAFFNDTDRLNIKRPSIACKATEHIDEMIELIKRLEERGHTYTSGGNVYFSIDTFPEYGKMAGLKLDELQSGARIQVDESKKNPKDFALWFTNSKFENQVMVWDSPWGKGYPGWHVECSAMSMKYLGEQFDIHCGGTDHVNVHHTNEIAQSEAATGKKWVNYWLHGEFLIDDTGKMSKSKGEFLTLDYLIKKGYDPLDYRYYLLGAHYRSPLLFSYKALDSARSARLNLKTRIDDIRISMMNNGSKLFDDCGNFVQDESFDTASISNKVLGFLQEFEECISRDLNIPRALAVLWSVMKDGTLKDEEKLIILDRLDIVLGLDLLVPENKQTEDISDTVNKLLLEREVARKERNYSRADEIRDILQQMEIEIKDTPTGTTWRKKV